MSCYFRHMQDIIEEAGIVIGKENKKQIDRIIHSLVKVEYKNCSPTWKALKAEIRADEKARSRFVKKLKQALKTESPAL